MWGGCASDQHQYELKGREGKTPFKPCERFLVRGYALRVTESSGICAPKASKHDNIGQK